MEKNYFGSNAKNLTKITMAFLFMLLTSATIIAQVVLAPVTVNTVDSQGNPLAAKFKVFKGPNYVGEFNTNTSVDLEVGATYKLFAHYEKTSTERVTFTVDTNGNTFNYSTTNITFHWSGGYLDYRGTNSWTSFGKTNGIWNSRELFPKDFNGNTMKIHFGKVWNDPRSVVIELDYSGKNSIEKVVSQLQLLDHNGDPLEGGTARGGYASPTVWHVNGTTDTNGLLIDMRDGSNSNLSYEMKFNNTTFQSAQQEDSFYSFQTQLITMKLENCDNAALEGGHVRWGHGTSFVTYHFAGGNTDANGVTSLEFFPGTYSFEMGYNSTTNVKSAWNFPNDGVTLTWQTTKLTLNYDGAISYGGTTGDAKWFTKPSMEMMRGGTYKFHFRDAGKTDITIAEDCEMTYNVNSLRLIDSNGDGLVGGTVKYWDGAWHDAPGETDSDGNILVTSTTSPTSWQMWYRGKPNQKDGSPASPIVFQTVKVTGELLDSNDGPLESNLQFYALSWQDLDEVNPIGTTFESELLPGSYNFDFWYEGMHSGNILQDITIDSHVVFNTVAASFSANRVDFYSQFWHNDIASPYEFMPGCYQFKFDGGPNTEVCITESGNYAFLRLIDSNSDGLAGGTVKYWDGAWHNAPGETDANGDLLLVSPTVPTSMQMWYRGKPQQKNDLTAPIIWQTIKVTGELNDSNGGDLESNLKFYALSWQDLNEVNPAGTAFESELLPGSYNFDFWYEGMHSGNILQDITIDSHVVFNTVAASFSANRVDFYSQFWHNDIASPYEFMPGCYQFKFDGGPNTEVCITESGDYGPGIVLMLLDQYGNGVAGGKAQPAYGGSWGAVLDGETDSDGKLATTGMPAGFTKIKMTVNQGSVQQYTAELEASNYTWYTQTATIKLVDDQGNGIVDGRVDQGGGYWDYQGMTDTMGELNIEMFPGSYKFKMTYNFTSQEITQNNTTHFIFQTGKVVGPTCTSYAAGSWRTFTDPMQLLPGARNFKFMDSANDNSFTVLVGEVIYIPNATVVTTVTNTNSLFSASNGLPFPNPFIAEITIPVEVPDGSKFKVMIFNSNGIKVATLTKANDYKEGTYLVRWDASSMPNGMYYYKIIAQGYGGTVHGKVGTGTIIKN